jgi:hypothetical protein
MPDASVTHLAAASRHSGSRTEGKESLRHALRGYPSENMATRVLRRGRCAAPGASIHQNLSRPHHDIEDTLQKFIATSRIPPCSNSFVHSKSFESLAQSFRKPLENQTGVFPSQLRIFTLMRGAHDIQVNKMLG